VRVADHGTLHFTKNMSTAAVFSGIEEAFGYICHPGLLCVLSKSELSASLFKCISSFISDINFSFG
jgi:hypothetical protein